MSAPRPEPATRRLAIVFVVPDFEPAVGGTTRQVGLQARELAARGHDVRVLTRRWSRDLPRREVRGGLPVERVGPPRRGAVADKLALLSVAWWLLRRRGHTDVVQILMQGDLATSSRLARSLERTCLTWAGLGDATDLMAPPGHGPRSWPRRAQWRLRLTALRRVRHVALSQAIAVELGDLGLPPSVRIPTPVDLAAFRPPGPRERQDARAAAGATPDETVVLYVGHLRELKAVDRLVTAFASFVGEGRPGRLVLVGGSRGAPDDTEQELREQVRSSGLEHRVTFTGTVDDVRGWLWSGDVLVLPSRREGLPNTLLEAMACGVPCIAPPSAGGREVLDDGAGLVPPTGEPADLLGALVELADDEELRARVRSVALARVQDFRVEAVVDAYEDLYLTGVGR
jgi:glycosyltransferase involved in cell wall biosynthesis